MIPPRGRPPGLGQSSGPGTGRGTQNCKTQDTVQDVGQKIEKRGNRDGTRDSKSEITRDTRFFALKTQIQMCRPSNKQTNRIVQSSNLRKINTLSKNVSIFRNLEVFQIWREISTSTLSGKNNASGQKCRYFGQRG